jgi:hypothetical protein
LEQGEGLSYKIGGLQADLQIEFRLQGPWCKVNKGIGLRVSFWKSEGLDCKYGRNMITQDLFF